MGSFTPMNNGKKETFAVSFDNIRAYTDQFVKSPKTLENLRHFDLITSDTKGNELCDPTLKAHFEDQLKDSLIPYELNHPYAASEDFLMYPNLTNCKGICFDIPKHSMTEFHADPYRFSLENIQISHSQLNLYANVITKALEKTFS